MTDAAPKPRGRPPTGLATTSTERNRTRRSRLAADAGMSTLTVLITPEARAALDLLTAMGATQSDVVSSALLARV